MKRVFRNGKGKVLEFGSSETGLELPKTCHTCGLALNPSRQNPYCSRCWEEISGTPDRAKDLWFAVTLLAVVLSLAAAVIIAGVTGQ